MFDKQDNLYHTSFHLIKLYYKASKNLFTIEQSLLEIFVTNKSFILE
jgi:hypothetical protein